jgi:two-component system, sensor histidine kinase ChiS
MENWAVIKSFFWVFIMALIIHSPTLAQESPTRFERISIEQGLSQVTIYCIFQDSRGMLWFGTEDGLNKYDGYTFTIYKRDPEDIQSLSANTILSIAEDASGSLWIGTENGGVNRFDRSTEKFTQHRHDPSNPHSLSHNTVTAIYEDGTGSLWIGTGGGGLDELDQSTGKFSHYPHDPTNPSSLSSNVVSAILEDNFGNLWISTQGGGLNQFDRATSKFTHYRYNPDDAYSLSSDFITSLSNSKGGHIWIGVNGGLNEFDPFSKKITSYINDPGETNSLSSNDVTTVLEDTAGSLWVGTSNGLNELLRNEKRIGYMPKFQRYFNSSQDMNSLSMDTITALYEDSSGVIWIGTSLGGLNKLDPKTRRFANYRNDPNNLESLGSNTIWAVLEDAAGKVWVGTSGPHGGLDRLDRQTGKFIHYRPDPDYPFSLPSSAVLVIYEDKNSGLWIGSYEGGLSRFDQETGRFYNYQHDPEDNSSLSNNIVWTILEDSNGEFWVGTMGGGLNLFNPESGSFTYLRHDPTNPASLSSDFILTLFEDSKGTLWIGTNQGLDRFDLLNQTIEHYKYIPADRRSLSSNAVPTILEDTKGNLWIGTDDGLNLFDPISGTFTHYTETDGLANDAIGCILEDSSGNLWISTLKGISKFDLGTGFFKNYDVQDGLQSNEFNRGACNKNSFGELYFGGINGFNVFDPSKIYDNPHIPPVILTDFKIFNQTVPIGTDSLLVKSIGETETITLSFRDYVFSFEFSALDFTLPKKNQYAYMLEGFDRDWIIVDSSRRFASYANLPPGSYTFLLKGSNNDGVWNETGTALQITITPPPWRTWWAYTLYALLIFAMVASAWRYRVKELERKHMETTMWVVQRERDRVAMLLESRRQLLASISHDLRTPVATVRAHMEATMSEGQSWRTQVRRLEVVSQELDRLQVLLDDLFTLSRLEVDRLILHPSPVDAGKVARRAVNAISVPAWQQGKVEVALQISQDEMCVQVDEQRLLQVLMNLLHNAVRHTLPGGIVVVRLNRLPEVVAISIQDTGEGIASSDLPYIWERFYRGHSQAGGGAGLGLALVKELTEAMGGEAFVESTLGEGSRFTVTLPLQNS